MTNYENAALAMSPLDEAMLEVAVLREQLAAAKAALADERQAHSKTRINMAWQIMDLKCREVK